MNKYQKSWLKALRSGQHDQIRGHLKLVDHENDETVGFCCLGVYCETNYPNEWENHESGIYQDGIDVPVDARSLEGFPHTDRLPAEDLDFLGLTVLDANFLANLNDGPRFTFDLIADVLEHAFQDGSIGVITAFLELGYDSLLNPDPTHWDVLPLHRKLDEYHREGSH